MSKKTTFLPTNFQFTEQECIAANMAMVLHHFKIKASTYALYQILKKANIQSPSSHIKTLSKQFGLGCQTKTEKDPHSITTPAILSWKNNHFLIFEGIKNNKIYINNPKTGRNTIDSKTFKENYLNINFQFTKEKKIPYKEKNCYIDIVKKNKKDIFKLTYLQIIKLSCISLISLLIVSNLTVTLYSYQHNVLAISTYINILLFITYLGCITLENKILNRLIVYSNL